MGRDKSKRFLKQKQGNQKRRSKFQAKTPESIAKTEIKSVSDISTHSQVESMSNTSYSEFDKSQFEIYNNDIDDTLSIDNSIANPKPIESIDSNANIAEMMDEHLRNLQEKDSIMRQTTLHRINRILRQTTECDSYLRAKRCDKLETLSMCLNDCLQHKETKLQSVALETISLLMISLQQDWHILEKHVYVTIMKLIEKPNCLKLKKQAVKTLCCMTWILNDALKKSKAIKVFESVWTQRVSSHTSKSTLDAANDEKKNQEDTNTECDIDASNESNEPNEVTELKDENMNETESEMKEFESKNEREELDVAAIESWTWLVASIGNDAGIGGLLEAYNSDFLDILEHNYGIDLRCAAGEALTLLVSNYKGNERYIIDSNENIIDLDEIEAVFYELSEECDIKRKNALKEQKRKFGYYLDCFVTDWVPRVKIKLKGKDYELEGWKKIIIYERIKNILKDGLQLHLLKNEMIQKIFDMCDADALKQLTQIEKKSKLMEHEDNAKQKKQHIKGRRDEKQAFMFNHTDE